ncbi:MAG: hypothetical protein IJ113_04340, partial [Eggerthellaceae bacterium]|nr:hypothetical protein [Eggerthellaceae bacterium]
MKQKGMVLASVFALLMALGLVGCAGPSPAEEFGSQFMGTWELVSASGDDNAVDAETFEILKEHGMSASLVLNEDGTYTFDVFGDAMNGTWEATAEDAATMEMSGQTVNLTLVNGQITIDQGAGAKLTFAKPVASAGSSEAASSEAGEASAAEAQGADEGTGEGTDENADEGSDDAAGEEASSAE